MSINPTSTPGLQGVPCQPAPQPPRHSAWERGAPSLRADFRPLPNRPQRYQGGAGPSSGAYVQQAEVVRNFVTPSRVIVDAHQDDIHSLAKLSESTFVSGSKDNKLKVWDFNREEPIKTMSRARRGYAYWVTSLRAFSNTLWASGTREGAITVWDQDNEIVREFFYTPSTNSRNQAICKDKNRARINCIAEDHADDESLIFYTGTPKFIQRWDGISGRLLRFYQAHENDWVYCINKLKKDHLIVVIGANLERWKMKGIEDPERINLIRENYQERTRYSRPHISAIERITNQGNLLASAFFDGSVRVVDIQTQQIVQRHDEHKQDDPTKCRVWTVINIQDNVIASGADDRTIKLWDIRQQRSSITIGGNLGRVSSLLRFSDDTFISGSCPDDVFESDQKATISFWDIKSLRF